MKTQNSRRRFLATSSLVLAGAASSLFARSAGTNTSSSSPSSRARLGMRVGSDVDKLAVKHKGPLAVLDYLHSQRFDGAFFRLMLDLSPALDSGELKEIKSHANSLGMFLDSGVGWMNPYNTAERPDIRRFGDGDYRLAIEKMLKAARLIDCTELWAVSAHSVHGDPFYVAYDRFRTDVSWEDQLAAMTKFISSLAPMLRDLQLRINLETHGDETSFELLRLIEQVGPECVGVTLDTGNLPLEADLPRDAINRLAPYVHLTHCKDGILYKTSQGIVQQIRTLGEGIIDWDSVIDVLGKHNPDLHLCLEDYRAENLLRFYDSKWRAQFPELSEADIREFERLAAMCEQKIKRGEIMGVDDYRKLPWGEQERELSYKEGAAYLRKIIRAKGDPGL
jgi:sugar phosphate isomerase/epimerase